MLPSVFPRLARDSAGRVFPGVWKPLFLKFPSWDGLPYLFLKTMVCFSGCLMSSASLQKLFCGVCSALKCSFDEFVREKGVSPSYSSAILGLPHLLVNYHFKPLQVVNWILNLNLNLSHTNSWKRMGCYSLCWHLLPFNSVSTFNYLATPNWWLTKYS